MNEEKDELDFTKVMTISGLSVLVILVLLIVASTIVG